jgi:hypothetical protein
MNTVLQNYNAENALAKKRREGGPWFEDALDFSHLLHRAGDEMRMIDEGDIHAQSGAIRELVYCVMVFRKELLKFARDQEQRLVDHSMEFEPENQS